jgi:hypothetical protein
VEGIPHFVQAEELTGFNLRFARLYDRFSWGYSAFVKVALPSCNPCTIVGEESSLLGGM